MSPMIIASEAKNILSNRKVQIALMVLLAYFLFKNKIKDAVLKYRQNKFDKNEGDTINQLVQQYRSAVNPSGVSWMTNFDGTKEQELEKLAYQTKGKLQLVANAYKLKFDESLTDRIRKELSVSAFQNWWNIVT